MKLIKQIYILLSLSCAGPMNPFGSSISINKSYQLSQVDNQLIKIKTYPEYQITHSPYELQIHIRDEMGIPKNFQYEIFYNNQKLNNWWKTEKVSIDVQDHKDLFIKFDYINLIPDKNNDIKIAYYRKPNQLSAVYEFQAPTCSLNERLELKNLERYSKTSINLQLIEEFASSYGVNPSLFAALIAQESSFNPKAISLAKAIGLTQVTNLASQEITATKSHWITDQRVSKLSYFELKTKILLGQISASDDWRLEPSKSIEGGAIYINKIIEYWSKPKHKKILQETFSKDVPITKIVLASYNSGSYRVKKSIQKNKKNWMEDKTLSEAKKYIKNIISYCYSFSQENIKYQNNKIISYQK